MRIYKIKVKNFRGIKEAEFNLDKSLICFIGAGDSTKSTILDAVEYVLYPYWFIPLDDSDFTNCDVSNEVSIEATIGPVPEELTSDSKFGLYLRGWNEDKNLINDEPEDADIRVLTLRLRINSYLVPEWTVINGREPEGKQISYNDRQRFNLKKIGINIDNELSWVRGSSLLKLSADKEDTEKILLDANRELRQKGVFEKISEITNSIKLTKEGAELLGLDLSQLNANIDPKSIRANTAILSLHNNNVPIRRLGEGSRRLVAIGAQLQNIEEGAIILIDEIEHTLEPHRIKHLVKKLRDYAGNGVGQILMTSHSPAVLEELGAKHIFIVRSDNNQVTNIFELGKEAQRTLRSIPEAFLSPRIIVCEGKTEIGLLRSYERNVLWRSDQSFNLKGVNYVNGGGTESAISRAINLKEHDYDVCLFIDSDKMDIISSKEEEINSLNIKLIRWKDEFCLERQLLNDLPEDALYGIVKLTNQEIGKSKESIIDCINNNLKSGSSINEIEDIKTYSEKKKIKDVVCKAAINSKWFKNITAGEKLGNYLFCNIWNSMKDTLFFEGFQNLEEWVFE